MKDFTETQNFMSLQDAIMYSCSEIVTIKDLNLKYVSCNKAFFSYLGIKEENSVIQKSIEDVFSPNNAYIIEKNSKMIMRTKEASSFILCFENEDYDRIIKTTSFPIIRNGILYGILSISRDITHEENLKLKIVEKVCLINSLLENMPMLVYMKDLNNNFVTGSKYAKKFVQDGYDAYAGNVQLDMDDAGELFGLDDNYVIGNKKTITSERIVKSKSGQQHWYKISKSPILDIDNEVTGIVSIAQNIDAEKQLGIQKELFLATLTHDLKTPLQAQISSLELLVKGTFGQVNSSQKEILDMIIESACFMREMLYSVLSTYKYENGLVKLKRENFNIDSLIQICLKETYYLAKEKGIEFEYRNSSTISIVNADETQIRRVIANMLNNSINYAYKNTKIYISFLEDEESFKIKIKNISEPIPESIKEHIFDKYVSGADLSKKRGIGLGLYFCKKVVDAHNGNIYLNAVETENEFVIELPKVDKNIDEKRLVFV